MHGVPQEIMNACNGDEVATVEQWLEESGRQLDGTDLLFQAAGHGHVAMMRMLISRGATLDYPALCERGRATAPSGVLARLFHGPRTSRRRTRRTVGPVVLPRELFACVLSFWRSERALDEDRADDRERFRHRLGY